MLNSTILEGRLTRDPELRKTQSGIAVATFTVACDRPRKKDAEQQADFINVVAWRQSAEFLSNYFHKGDAVQVQGRIQTRTYDDKNGNKVFVTEVVAYNINFPLTSKNGGNSSNSSTNRSTAQNSAPTVEDPFVDTNSVEISDDDLPF